MSNSQRSKKVKKWKTTKKLFLTLVAVLACLLGLAMVVLADTVHNETTVDYNETVILDNGDKCYLFDSKENALI